jgi:hypothetical protein
MNTREQVCAALARRRSRVRWLLCCCSYSPSPHGERHRGTHSSLAAPLAPPLPSLAFPFICHTKPSRSGGVLSCSWARQRNASKRFRMPASVMILWRLTRRQGDKREQRQGLALADRVSTVGAHRSLCLDCARISANPPPNTPIISNTASLETLENPGSGWGELVERTPTLRLLIRGSAIIQESPMNLASKLCMCLDVLERGR